MVQSTRKVPMTDNPEFLSTRPKTNNDVAIESVPPEWRKVLRAAERAVRREWRPLPTCSQSRKIRPRFDEQRVFKRERERVREMASPLGPYDPSTHLKQANRTKNQCHFINKAQASLLPNSDLRIIQSKIANDFTTHIDRAITRFIQPFIQQVSAGQLKEPVVLSSSLRDCLVPSYCSAVRQAVRAYAADVVLS